MRGIVQLQSPGRKPEPAMVGHITQELLAHADEYPATTAAFVEFDLADERNGSRACGLDHTLEGMAAHGDRRKH